MPEMETLGALKGVREYQEEDEVELAHENRTNRLVIVAYNEGRCNCTKVDLLDLLEWVENHPKIVRYYRETAESEKAQ
jgi:hypothetical protein